MVGAGAAVFVDARQYRRLVAVDDERLAEPLGAPAHEVLVTEAQPPPVVRVVLETGVEAEMGVRALQELFAGLTEDDGLFDADELVADRLARPSGVFGHHEVRMDAIGEGGPNLEHLRAECGDDLGDAPFTLGCHHGSGVHRRQILAHRRDR